MVLPCSKVAFAAIGHDNVDATPAFIRGKGPIFGYHKCKMCFFKYNVQAPVVLRAMKAAMVLSAELSLFAQGAMERLPEQALFERTRARPLQLQWPSSDSHLVKAKKTKHSRTLPVPHSWRKKDEIGLYYGL